MRQLKRDFYKSLWKQAMINNKYFQFLLSLFLVFSILGGTLPFRTSAQTQTPTRGGFAADLQSQLRTIEEKIEKRRAELNIPGISLAIVKDGEIVYLKGFGYKDFEKKIAVTPDTQFPIASATKAFTALSVLMAQDEGKLSIDDNPKKYLPYFKINDAEIDKNITIRDLLSHASGITRTDLGWLSGKLDREEIIRVAGEAKPTAKLRERFQYQNVMYTAAGEVVARVQKKLWEKFVTERIFAPLGMNNSTMSITEMKKVKDYSFGYNYNFETRETLKLPYADVPQVAPAGSINSSASDMAKWVKFVLNRGTVGGKRLVSEKGFDEWLKPQQKITANGKINYSLGWFLQEWNGFKVVQHGGNTAGFNSMVAMIPEKNIGFVMLTNVSASPLGAELMSTVWESFLGKPDAPKTDDLAANQNGSNSDSARESNGTDRAAKTNSAEAARELIGKYQSEQSKDRFVEIKEVDGKVSLVVPGQRPYPLIEREKDLYNPQSLPDSYSLQAKRDENGKISGIVMIQPNASIAFKYAGESEKVEEPKITADEVMAKTIGALGGEVKWRKILSHVVKFEIDYENQGIKGYGATYAKAPNLSAVETTLTGLGKPIASSLAYFDGNAGMEITSFVPSNAYTGQRLEDVKLENDFYGLLNWKNNLKTVEIKGVEKIVGEDVYVVVFRPEKASEYTYYISLKTFLPVGQQRWIVSGASEQRMQVTSTFSDYRPVDGVMMPFKTVSVSSSMGSVSTYVKEVKQNVPIDDKKFKPMKK